MVTVAVTEPEYRKAPALFAAAENSHGLHCAPVPPSEAALAAALSSTHARHAIVGVERYTGALYSALSPGSVLARFGVGHDSIDKAKATAASLLVTNTPGALDDSVAEMAMLLIASAARRLPTCAEQTRQGEWKPVVGSELRGRRLAIIGAGPIGCRVAGIAARGFGMQVTACARRHRDLQPLQAEFGIADFTIDFDAAVASADFMSLHIPATPENRHFINAERLAHCPRHAWLINTARGSVVDELALHHALSSGGLAGAALDVFENEPYAPATPGSDLRSLPNVIMTPHIGSSTREACDRMAARALANIAAAERGDYGSMDIINREVLTRLKGGSW